MSHRWGLDGVRGIAVLLVVLAHTTTKTLGGGVGVTIFFVLSGFLITSLLLKELDATGRINLGSFYARRALRLFPALLTVLAATPLLMLVTNDPRLHEYPLWALLTGLYLMDYARAVGLPETPLGHTWSLGVEEQFYLIWPVALILAFLGLRRNPRAFIVVVGIITLAAMVWRLLAPSVVSSDWTSYSLDTNAFPLLLGCFMATLSWAGVRLPSGPAVIWSTLGALAAITCSTIAIDAKYMWDYYPMAAAVIAAFLIPAASDVSRSFLVARPLTWLGKVSYALYLWHFVLLKIEYQGDEPRSVGLRVALALTSIALAWASWHAVEKPCLRLKRHFENNRAVLPQNTAGRIRGRDEVLDNSGS
ncbi:acyltransferase family protein [Curtobacterium sp. 260]|uniref:acyltransferase family protein n=1 Tax=Curtobacterium sp. 260 TaxID=2817748 RepID=UPI0027880468|nr:acyltransferase [Curtobacterium sp. 260]MDP9736955.1 peptidoglycan/LPS O-acetylase OafA/YrhL [Curtobacterium sp. 260]